jgi:hypothetical protein
VVRDDDDRVAKLKAEPLSFGGPKSLAVLFEIRGRVVEDFVLLQKGLDLRPRLENKEPPKLCCGQGSRPICLEC